MARIAIPAMIDVAMSAAIAASVSPMVWRVATRGSRRFSRTLSATDAIWMAERAMMNAPAAMPAPMTNQTRRAISTPLVSASMADHGTPPHKPDPQYRKQDHIVFAALAVPIFAVSFLIIALIVTLGQH